MSTPFEDNTVEEIEAVIESTEPDGDPSFKEHLTEFYAEAYYNQWWHGEFLFGGLLLLHRYQ